jgi:pyruvate,water dikinase
MTNPLTVSLDQITPADRGEVGGKGLSLGLLHAAGFPVPPGFCITTTAYLLYRPALVGAAGSGTDLTDEIIDRYRKLGSGLVAVRSSATAEDAAQTSFAGQQETILGVGGEQAVLEAVARCWASLHTDRAVAYREKQGVGEHDLAMAVVVQRLVQAEVSGVLFTHDPLDPEGRRMLVEAAWGLGESVVAGKVTPDRYHLNRDTGQLLDQQLGTKATRLTATGPETVPAEKQTERCLKDTQLAELAELGRRVEGYFGDARDVEFAWAEGRFWLLQARPITAGGAAERDQVRREEIAALRARAEPTGTVWARFNLSEVLPEPTPMTWAIVRRFMSGRGGYGLMYRDLEFDPDPALDEDGVFDLVCGRPYCNLSREPRLLFRQLPFEHPFAVLKAAPHKALYPQAVLNPARAGWRFWLALPVLLPVLYWKLLRSATRVRRLTQTLAATLREQVFPAFAAETDRAAAQDLSQLSTAALRERLENWVRRTLFEFARDSLKPTALAAITLKNVEKVMLGRLGPERTNAALGELSLGARPDPEADLSGAVQDLIASRLDRAAFLECFGHRGSQEMAPRAAPLAGAGRRGQESPPGTDCGRGPVVGVPKKCLGSRGGHTSHLPGSPGNRQALFHEGVCPDPPHSGGAGPALPAQRRHLLPDAGRAARAGGRR